MVKTRAQSRLQETVVNIYTTDSAKFHNGTLKKTSPSIIWHDDDTFLEEIKKEIEAGVKHEDSQTRKVINQHDFIKENRVAKDAIEHSRDLRSMYDDSNYVISSLQNKEGGTQFKILANGLNANIPYRRKEVIWIGPPAENVSVKMQEFDVRPPITDTTERNVIFPEILPVVDWTVEDVCPGWNSNVWKIFYEFYPGGASIGDYSYDEKAIWKPCTSVDSFWFASEPSKYKGLVVCMPNPLEFLQYKWEYDKFGLLGIFVVYLIFMIGIYKVFVPKHIKEVVENVPEMIVQAKRGRKAKEKEKEE